MPACRASVGSRAARGPFGPYGPDGRSGGTLGRMIVVWHDLDQYHDEQYRLLVDGQMGHVPRCRMQSPGLDAFTSFYVILYADFT